MNNELCGAKTRNGGTCKKWAMENGRCRLHGGASLRGSEHPNFKHGLYTKYTPAKIAEKIENFLEADPLNLENELALTRALLAEFISRFEHTPLDVFAIGAMADLVANIGKTVERIARIKNETALTAAEVTYLAARCAELVSRYIPNPDEQQAFISELFNGAGKSDTRLPGKANNPESR